MRLCSIEGCGRKHLALGLCHAHYNRRRKGTDLDPPIQIRDPNRGCSVEGCGKKHYGLGLCCVHYANEYNPRYYQTHLDEILLQKKEYQDQHCDEISKKKKERYDLNIDKNRADAREYAKQHREERNSYKKERYSQNPDFRISMNLRVRLNNALCSQNATKTSSAVRDLGCTIPELKVYLEGLFQPGMTWENHGVHGWHIDHIRPMSSFDLTDPEQQKVACHYTNLQPLWAEENLLKGARYGG